MSGPYVPSRSAQPLDLLEKQSGWEGLEELLVPKDHREAFQPDDPVAKFLYGMTMYPDGREVIEWLMDITLRQPLRVTGTSIEQTALQAAVRQGINGVGEAVMAAIAKGRQLSSK